MPWDGDPVLEEAIKAATGASLRCMPMDTRGLPDVTGGTHGVALFAKAY